MKHIYILIITAIFFASCVSPVKYQKVVDERDILIRENASLKYLKEQSKKNKEEIKNLKDKLAQTEEVLFEVNNKYTSAKERYEDCQRNYDKMLLENKKLLERAFADKTNMTEELAEKEKLLSDKEKNLQKLERELNEKQLKLQLLRKDLELRERKIDSLHTLVEMKDNKLAAIKNKIKEALTGYSTDDISVKKGDDGRLYVSLSQNLLFDKGSNKLDAAGKAALIKLANALKNETGLNILVEGHTDSDGNPDRNWILSTQRALAVVKILEQYGVMPQKLTAAGRGQYHPVVPNTTEANKAKNRRTEIIIEPDVSKIYDFLK